MYYYLICKKHKLYCISGLVNDFGPSVAKNEISNFITRAMVNNWQIELVDELKMSRLDKDQIWTEYKSWMIF